MTENGIGIGELQIKLVEKVEELTLYSIELKTENEELKKQIELINLKLNELQNAIVKK